jgi:type II secretory pathway pseudopilin PulG
MQQLRKDSMKQRGDTIIEVLLALTVVGLSLGIAYGITTRSLNIGQNAQERTEAVKLAESQIEILKNFYNFDVVAYEDTVNQYCLIEGVKVLIPNPDTDPTAPSCLSEDENSVHGFYDIELRYTEASGGDPEYFESIVRWVTPGSRLDPVTGDPFKDEVILRYRP